MEWETVEGSSNIAAIAYDANTQVLGIRFTNGRTYTYPDVPADVATQFRDSESKGKFFFANIRNKFAHTEAQEASEAQES